MIVINTSPAAVIGLVTGFCSTTVVSTVIRSNVADGNLLQNAIRYIGSVGIGMTVLETIQKNTTRQVQEIIDAVEIAKKQSASK